ncbi:uncharacterized protein LOC133839973 [Drosophila sulfurigaster albostrigata]|uniref:uncharacterized protein LOC133839973 n=1 Tax=Drosophila sulfurigaster albostrigata TaxID=89887 RepID=UPI002D21CA92|nr:uncharacterized protein LOC133839973 [Drosophila sulfurigaster albostrigata]
MSVANKVETLIFYLLEHKIGVANADGGGWKWPTTQQLTPNSQPSLLKKSSTTGAVVNLKKLLKTVKRIFNSSKMEAATASEVAVNSSCPTEEELQNLLNEQLETSQIALC